MRKLWTFLQRSCASRMIVNGLFFWRTLVGAAVFSGAVRAQAVPPDPPSFCTLGASGPALAVEVSGFKARTGNIRIYVYGDDPADFLKKKKRIKRVNVPVTRIGALRACVRLPRPGRYALIVQHDVNGNKRADWKDGGGASRNPEVTLLRLRPRYHDVAFTVKQVEPVNILLKYR